MTDDGYVADLLDSAIEAVEEARGAVTSDADRDEPPTETVVAWEDADGHHEEVLTADAYREFDGDLVPFVSVHVRHEIGGGEP